MKRRVFDKTYLVLGGMVGVMMLTGGILTLPGAFADGNDTSVSTATITVPVTCTMVGTTNTAHTAEIPNGIDSRSSSYYPNGIGTTTLKAYCNDNEGFAVYAVGYTGDTIGNTYLRDSNLGQTADIATGTADSGATSSWSMRIGVTSGTYTPIIAGSSSDSERQSGDTDYSGWAAVPSSYQRVAYRNSGTDVNNESIASAEGASLTTTYAAYISPTQQSGTYVGKVKYTLVHPASEYPVFPQTTEAGCIRYYPNGGNVEGTMGCQEITSSDTSATLLASNFSRAGYGFAGWNTEYDYSGTNYGPQEDITFTEGQYTGSNPGLSLYARWIKSAGNLQGWTGCSSLASGAVTALTDQRDNETYAVAKLADGNCWMIENLRLESTNSDNSAGVLAQGYGTSGAYGNFSGLATAESTNFSDTITANSLYYSGTQEGTASVNIGTTDYPGNRMPRYNNINTSTRANNPTSNYDSMYSYGNYYTWHAAIADTTYYSSGDHGNTSLCPTGWRLPMGAQSTTNMSFGKLSVELGGPAGGAAADSSSTPTGTEMSKVFRSYPNNFLYSGYFNEYYPLLQGTVGYYWSSTARTYSSSYRLYFYMSYVYPGTGGYNMFYGGSIRCMVLPSA